MADLLRRIVLLSDRFCILCDHFLGELEFEADQVEAAGAQIHGGKCIGLGERGLLLPHLRQQDDGALGVEPQILRLGQELWRTRSDPRRSRDRAQKS